MTEQPPPERPSYSSYPTSAQGTYDLYADRTGDRRPPVSKTQAFWALVLSFVPMPLSWIAAVVLSSLVLSRSKDGRDHGKGMAISALVIVAVWVVLIVGLVAADISNDATRNTSGKVSSQGDVLVSAVQVGDCLPETPGASAVLTVELIPCSKVHLQEAYANFVLADGDFPGQETVDRLAEGGCIKRYEAYVGLAYDKTSLEVVYLRPLSTGWSRDRGVTCLVSDGGPSTGSLKDSQR